MFIKLKRYEGGHRIVSIVSCAENESKIQNYGYDVVKFDGESLSFTSDQYKYILDDEEKAYFHRVADFSIIEFDKNAVICFNAESEDNVIFITNRCNSSCKMCPISSMERRQSSIQPIENLIKICSQIPEDTCNLTISGGEPFLIKEDIFTLLEYLKNKFHNTFFQLLTNGRIFTNQYYVEKFIETSPEKMIVGIPIHGHNEELHDSITQVKGSFNQTINGIKHLIRSRISVEVRLVVSKLNIHFINEIATFITKELNGILNVKFIGLEMMGDALNNYDEVWIPYSESAKKMEKAIDYLVLNEFDVGIFNYPLCSINKSYWPICEESISDYKIRYLEQCDMCKVRNFCGGMFQSTKRFLKNDIKAVK